MRRRQWQSSPLDHSAVWTPANRVLLAYFETFTPKSRQEMIIISHRHHSDTCAMIKIRFIVGEGWNLVTIRCHHTEPWYTKWHDGGILVSLTGQPGRLWAVFSEADRGSGVTSRGGAQLLLSQGWCGRLDKLNRRETAIIPSCALQPRPAGLFDQTKDQRRRRCFEHSGQLSEERARAGPAPHQGDETKPQAGPWAEWQK